MRVGPHYIDLAFKQKHAMVAPWVNHVELSLHDHLHRVIQEGRVEETRLDKASNEVDVSKLSLNRS